MKKYQKRLFEVLFLIGMILLAFYLAETAKETESIRNIVFRFGYLGVFIAAVISGFNLVVPIPAAAFIPLMLESGLKFWPAVILIVIGVSSADMIAFFIGKISHNITYASPDSEKILYRLEKMREKFRFAPMLTLFLFSTFAPFPSEIILAPLGFMGYRFSRVFPFVLLGNFLFTILYSSILLNVFHII